MRRLGPGGGIKGRIKGIEIAAVQLFLRDAEKFTESLVMDQLTFPKKTNRLAYIVIPDNTKNVVVGRTGLLFCCNCERTTYHVKQIGQAAFIHAKTEY